MSCLMFYFAHQLLAYFSSLNAWKIFASLSLFAGEGCFFSVCGEEIYVTYTQKAAMLGVLSFLRTTPIVLKIKYLSVNVPIIQEGRRHQ